MEKDVVVAREILADFLRGRGPMMGEEAALVAAALIREPGQLAERDMGGTATNWILKRSVLERMLAICDGTLSPG